MDDHAARLGAVYTERALTAAGAPRFLFLCRRCDYQWTSSCPRCAMCGRQVPRQQEQGGVSLFDPVKVQNPSNIGVPHTMLEALTRSTI